MLHLFVRKNHIRTLFLFVLLAVATPIAARRTYNLHRWHVPHANYSGITHLGENRYAVVSDQEREAGFHLWQIDLNTEKGKLTNVAYEGWRGVDFPIDRDAEGIAFVPEWQTLFVSGEEDQRILEHRLDGSLTERELLVPQWADAKHIQTNRGFEALCYDAKRNCFWTVTESAVRNAPRDTLRLMAFGTDLQLRNVYPYPLDAEQAKNHGRDHYHGVVAITPAPTLPQWEGSLLVLERECRIAPHYMGSRCWCKLYRFVPETGEKTLVQAWSSRFSFFNARMANYEGMCLGPQLNDGRATLLVISDSQAGYGRALWHLKDYLRLIILN